MNKDLEPFQDVEGKIFLSGISLVILFVLFLMSVHLWYPDKMTVICRLIGSRLLFGRAAGIYIGFVLNISHAVNLLINIFIDSIWLLIFYPLVIFSLRNLLKNKLLKSQTDRIVDAAHKNQNHIKRFGLPGLFLFILCPLPMTGPIVGGVIGNFMGIKPWINVGVGLSATYLGVGIWFWVLSDIHQKAVAYNSLMPFTIFGIFVVCGVLLRVVHRRSIVH